MQLQTFDFPVALRPIFDEDGNQIPKARHVVRTDVTPKTSFGVVSDRYRLIKHSDVRDSVQPLIRRLQGASQADLQQQTHIERFGGNLILQYTFPNQTRSVPAHRRLDASGAGRATRDTVALRLYANNSYNGRSPMTVRVGAVVLVCLNGATAFDGVFDLNVKHIGEARDIQLPDPDLVMRAFQETTETWERWAEMPINSVGLGYLVEEARKLQLFSERAYEKERSRFTIVETVWDAYNVFTYMITHTSPKLRTSSRLGRSDRLNLLFSHATSTENLF